LLIEQLLALRQELREQKLQQQMQRILQAPPLVLQRLAQLGQALLRQQREQLVLVLA
jgi:hypothetical protein